MLSSTVDKHWVPVPVWKWWSRRVPMCCLQVITNINNTHTLNRKCWTRIGFRQNIFFASESLHQLLDLESANQSLQTEQRWKNTSFLPFQIYFLGASRHWEPDVSLCLWRPESAYIFRNCCVLAFFGKSQIWLEFWSILIGKLAPGRLCQYFVPTAVEDF